MSYEIDWQDKGQITRFTGHVTGAELVRYLEEVAADPRFDDIRFSITDWSLVSSGEVARRAPRSPPGGTGLDPRRGPSLGRGEPSSPGSGALQVQRGHAQVGVRLIDAPIRRDRRLL